MAAAGRADRGNGGHPRVRGGAPGPQARQRAAGHRRAAGDRFRDLAGHGRDRADCGRSGVRHAGLHVARAGRGQAGRARERHVRAGVRDRVRGHGGRAVRHRDRGRRPVPGRARRGRPGRGAARAAGDRLRVPGQGPGRPAGARGAGRRDHGPGPRDRAVRGGVLAAAGGQRDRRLPGPAGAGDQGIRPSRRGVLLGERRIPGDCARAGSRGGGMPGPRQDGPRSHRCGAPERRARPVRRTTPARLVRRVTLAHRGIQHHRDIRRHRGIPGPRVTAGRRGRRRRRAATCRTLSR